MKLIDVISRKPSASPWESGGKIPWNDPAFSARMLRNHLSQEHDWASRRLDIIERHVSCIDRLLSGRKSRILDFGCGPGLYTHRLARLGHECTGVDFSPASIDYAKESAAEESLQISYELRDLREFVPAGRFDLVTMLFGEFNVFEPNAALNLLKAAFASLKDDGRLLIEVSSFDSILADGKLPATWEPLSSGLFSDNPHLYLQEHFWDEVETSATARYTIIDAQTGSVAEYGSTTKAYHEHQYLAAFEEAGFRDVRKLAESEWPPGEIFANRLQTYYCSRGTLRSGAVA